MRLQLLLLLSLIVLSGCVGESVSTQATTGLSAEHTLRIGMDYQKAKQLASAHGFEPEPFRGAYRPTDKHFTAFDIVYPEDQGVVIWHAKDGDTVTGISLFKDYSDSKESVRIRTFNLSNGKYQLAD